MLDLSTLLAWILTGLTMLNGLDPIEVEPETRR